MNNKDNFKSKVLLTTVMFILTMSLSQIVSAQHRLSLEFRPAVDFATKKLGDANLKPGFGAEGILAYHFTPAIAVYAGWSWNKFGSNQKNNGTNLDFDETGYSYGLQFLVPIAESKIDFFARGGGLYNHIEVEEGNDIINDSGHGFGWQVEGGVAIPVGDRLKLLPTIRYRSLSRNVTIERIEKPVDLNYLSTGLGIQITF
jgi:hypothetical protein